MARSETRRRSRESRGLTAIRRSSRLQCVPWPRFVACLRQVCRAASAQPTRVWEFSNAVLATVLSSPHLRLFVLSDISLAFLSHSTNGTSFAVRGPHEGGKLER